MTMFLIMLPASLDLLIWFNLLALSASEISMINSELPLCWDVWVTIKSILHIFPILNDAIRVFFMRLDIGIWYHNEYQYLSLDVLLKVSMLWVQQNCERIFRVKKHY